MAVGMMARYGALNQIQEDTNIAHGIDQAFAQGGEIPAGLTFGQREAISQPLTQAESIQSYIPSRTEIKQPMQPTPSTDAAATDNSLVAYLQNQAGRNQGRAESGVYSETMSNDIGRALDTSSRVSSQMQNLGSLSPEQRAALGGRYGAGLGAAVGNGPIGALVGSGMGALAARSIGMVQSGERDAAQRRTNIINTLQTMKVIDDKGKSPFFGSDFTISDTTRLTNLSGNGDRSAFEIDMSNPLSRRATTVARPLARYIAQGLMNQFDDNGGPITRSTDQTTGMIVNMLTDGTNNINDVYGRAREFSDKLGVSQNDMRSYFSAQRHRIPITEANEIKQGLDRIYGS